MHPADEALARYSRADLRNPENRVRAVAHEYSVATGAHADLPPDSTQRAAIAEWITAETSREPFRNSLSDEVARGGVYTSWMDKVRRLQSRPCDVCDTRLGPGVPVIFDVPIEPFSAQTDPSNLSRQKSLVRDFCASQPFISQRWRNLDMCIQVVAALGRSRRIKDADNLLKGFLDALQGVMYENDKRIQHLDVVRLRVEHSFGVYAVMARPVHPVEADILVLDADAEWRQRLI